MSYPTKKSHKCKKISSLDQSHADSQLQIFCNNFLWWLLTICQRLENSSFSLSLKRSVLCICKKGACLKGNWSSFVGKCIQNGRRSTSILAYDRMTLLKNFLDVSISSPSKNSAQLTQTTGVPVNEFKMWVHSILLKSSISFISKLSQRWCFLLWWRGLLYSIGREAERADRLYQYFERVGER